MELTIRKTTRCNLGEVIGAEFNFVSKPLPVTTMSLDLIMSERFLNYKTIGSTRRWQ